MNKKDWKKYFAPKILSRGLEYYQAGLVYDAKYDEYDNSLCANVSGTEEYAVSIYYDDNHEEIVEMYCDCPYAEDGYNCKHMAALLYAFDDGLKMESRVVVSENSYDSIKSLIDSLSEAKTKEFLLEAVLKDNSLLDKIKLMSAETITDTQIKKCKNKIVSIIDYAGNMYGYIGYDRAYDMFKEINEYLDKHIDVLIDKNLYNDAFELICCAYEEINSYEIDDSDGGYTDFLSLCEYNLKIIIDAADIVFKRKIFYWLLENDFEYSFIDHFGEKEFLEKYLHLIEERIGFCSAGREYMLFDYVETKCSLLKKLKVPENDILKFRNEYRYLFNIRKNDADNYLENCNYAEAEKLAIEGKNTDKEIHYLSAWSRLLLTIYEKTEQTEKLKKELINYIFELKNFDLDRIKELKKFVSKYEWVKIRDRLIDEKRFFDKFEFLCSERLYKELLESIVRSNSSNLFITYEKELIKALPIETRDAFLKMLDNEMERANQRNWYERIASNLCRIRKRYPDGKVCADKLARKWVNKYKRRSAMLEELRYAGFDV